MICFFKRYCCFCFKRGFRHDRDGDVQNYDRDNVTDHSNYDVIEGELREGRSNDRNDTASTIPSVITISRRSFAKGRRWYRRRKAEDNFSGPSAPSKNNRALGSAALSFMTGQRRSIRDRRRRQRRRHRRDRLLLGIPHSPTTPSESSPRTSPCDSYNSFFDHATNLTSSCDDMSLPEEGLGIDVVAANGRNKTTTNNNSDRLSVDPPGIRLAAGEPHSVMDVESYPTAIIQFRNPINGKINGTGGFLDEEEMEELIYFLVHTEEYVRYPRSKLTVLLCARAPETDDDREELQHLQGMIADASSSSSRSASATSFPSGNVDFAEGQRQQRLPLQIEITIVSCEEDLLRCAPTGGFLVTFGSIWELPQDHPDFLIDLVV